MIYDPLRQAQSDYDRAPLDEVSLINGALKYCHDQKTMSPYEYRTVLDWMDHLYGWVLECPAYTLDQAVEALDLEKAAGPPFNYFYGPTKGDVLNHLSPRELLAHFFQYAQYEDATTKDELRPHPKDARFFVPANLQTVLVGNCMFGAQNDRIKRYHAFLPIKIGVITPGFDMYRMWSDFYAHPGSKYHTDGSWYDALYPQVLAMLCRDLRLRHLPRADVFFEGHTYEETVERYYDVIYSGLVNVAGNLFNLPGQLSGQTNTASDNSFGNLAVLCLHAIRNRMPFDIFRQQLFLIMGDDMAYSDSSGLFQPLKLETTFNSLGMFLESPCVSGVDITEIMFCGCSPMWRELGDRKFLLYCYRKDKLLASFDWRLRGMTKDQRAQKLISITALLFPDKTVFDELCCIVKAYLAKHESDLSNETLSLCRLLDEQYLLKLFTGFESRFSGEVSFSFPWLEENAV